MPNSSSPATPAARGAARDSGFILPMTLVLTVVLGAVAVALAGYTASSLRFGRTIQDKTERLAAADAGARVGLEKLRTKSATCTSAPASVYAATIDNKAVNVTCQRTALMAEDAGAFALVVTAVGVPAGTPSWISQGTNVASQPRLIGGNVYLTAPPAVLDKPVSITDGDLWYPAASDGSCTDPTYNNLTFKPVDERGYNCTTTTWQTLFPMPPLPTVSGTGRSTGKTNADGCTVFSPGTYTKAPVIGAGTQNFFQPGTYYFDLPNNDNTISIKNALVIGGVPGTAPTWAGSSAVARTPSTFVSPWCAGAIAAATSANPPNTGVTFIFGGQSHIAVDPNGLVELFAPPAINSTQIMRPTIIALQSPTGGYKANTLGSTGVPLIDMQEGSNDGVVVHGGVWAPANAVRIGNIAQSANGQFMGGLVVGLLNMQAAANVGNFNMRVVTTPAQRKVVVTSTADKRTSISVVAILRASTGSLSINSWRIT